MKRNEPHLSLSPSLFTRVKKCYVITCNWKWWDFSSDRMRQPYAHYAGLVSTADQSVMKIQKFLLFCHRFHPQLLCLYRHSQRSLTMARHKANNTVKVRQTYLFFTSGWKFIYTGCSWDPMHFLSFGRNYLIDKTIIVPIFIQFRQSKTIYFVVFDK